VYEGDRDPQAFYAAVNNTDPTAFVAEEPTGTTIFPALLVPGTAPTVNTDDIFFAARVSYLPDGGTVVWQRPNLSEALRTLVGGPPSGRDPSFEVDNPYAAFVTSLPDSNWNQTNNPNPNNGTWTVSLYKGRRATGPLDPANLLVSRTFVVTNDPADAVSPAPRGGAPTSA
jgi:hypothetical protein